MVRGRAALIGVSLAAAVAATASPAPGGVRAAAIPHTARGQSLVARPAHARLVLRAAPGGRRVATVRRRGVFGGPTVLGVVARRGPWLGVTSEALPNGTIGWVDGRRDVRVALVRYAIAVDLSRRRLDVLRDGAHVRSMRVAIGSPSSPTPVGRFALAEKLPASGVYGCCILALTAHQPHPPAGWSRTTQWFVAIHGGGGIGSAVSAGCFHVAESQLRWLMRTVPAGTPVTVHA